MVEILRAAAPLDPQSDPSTQYIFFSLACHDRSTRHEPPEFKSERMP